MDFIKSILVKQWFLHAKLIYLIVTLHGVLLYTSLCCHEFSWKEPFIVDFNTVWCPATWWTPGSRTFTHPPSSTPSGINYNTICILWTSYFFIQSVTQSGVKPFLCWPITQQNSHVQTLMSISAKGGLSFSISLFSLFHWLWISLYWSTRWQDIWGPCDPHVHVGEGDVENSILGCYTGTVVEIELTALLAFLGTVLLTLSAMAGFQTHISKCFERGVKLNFLIFFS